MTAAADPPVDLGAGAEHRREGDRGVGPRHGHGHRQVEDRGAQRHGRHGQRAGQGTTITIKLPLTLAILPSLMVEIDGDVFAMPMESVVEIVSVGRDQVPRSTGSRWPTVRGRVISAGQARRRAELPPVPPRDAETRRDAGDHAGGRRRRRPARSAWPSTA